MAREYGYRDGFLLMHAELPNQLACSPDVPEAPTAAAFAESYSLFDTLSAARKQALDTARDIFEAAQAGNIEDRFETLEDVPQDQPMLARVFDHGGVFLYHLREGEGDLPAVAQHRCPDIAKSIHCIYGDVGMEVPVFASSLELPI